MKKIGLLTFPRYFNYGTQLQLFALQSLIERFGYTCEVIDYHRLYITANRQAELRQRQWQRLITLLMDPLRIIRHRPIKRYDRHFEELTKTRNTLYQSFLDDFIHLGVKSYHSYHELENDPPVCDAFIVGSDQVWSPISHFLDDSYYLAFAEQSRRIAYAPSIAVSEISENAREWMRRGLNGIPHLSVREQRGAELIQELTGREARVVLDPTLLLSASDWEKISRPTQRHRPYVLCYFLEADAYMRDHARNLALSHNCDLVVIPVNRVDVEDSTHDMQKEYDVGPREFLGLFRNAACVCTDSFHGTVFSILFQRPFFTFRRYANRKEAALHSRISNILEIAGLQSREMSREKSLPEQPLHIDYTGVNDRLDTWRLDSINFLKKALHEATQ